MKIALAILLAGLASAPCIAQDDNWSGWFAGFNAGYVGRSATSPADGTIDSGGPTASIFAGHWWQLDQITLGVEGSISLGGPRHSHEFPLPGDIITFEGAETVASAFWAKAGVPIGRLMPYVGVGVQFIQNSATWKSAVFGTDTSYSTSTSILAVGGIEAKLTDQWSIRAELEASTFINSPPDTTNFSWAGRSGLLFNFD